MQIKIMEKPLASALNPLIAFTLVVFCGYDGVYYVYSHHKLYVVV